MKARVERFTPADYRIMPWKNGGGSTTELLIAPRDATVQAGFDWRISLAQVPTSGPFSAFPQYQRTIMLLRGDPMRLLHKGYDEHILHAFQPYDFHGSWPTEAVLSGGPVEDFNVMVRDGWGQADILVLNASDSSSSAIKDADLHFIWAWSGDSQISVGHETFILKQQDSILLEGHSEPVNLMASTTGVLIIVSMQRQARPLTAHQ